MFKHGVIIHCGQGRVIHFLKAYLLENLVVGWTLPLMVVLMIVVAFSLLDLFSFLFFFWLCASSVSGLALMVVTEAGSIRYHFDINIFPFIEKNEHMRTEQ